MRTVGDPRAHAQRQLQANVAFLVHVLGDAHGDPACGALCRDMQQALKNQITLLSIQDGKNYDDLAQVVLDRVLTRAKKGSGVMFSALAG